MDSAIIHLKFISSIHMTAPDILNGRLHSGHFVCIRDHQRIGDVEILDRLGISEYQRLTDKKPNGPYVVLFDAGTWTVIADSWYYNLWHSPQTRLAIDALARAYDLYVCSVGDCDLSYSIEYHENGTLRRKHVVDAPGLNDQIVTADFGEPLHAEVGIWKRDIDDYFRIQLLGESLGIPLIVSDSQLRIYCIDREDETESPDFLA